jgi:HEAT repeat protein
MISRLLTTLALIAICSPVFGQATTPDPVPKLLANLDSTNTRVSASAARSLGVIFTPGQKARADKDKVVDALIGKLTARQGGALRRETATALGNIQAAKAVDTLKETLKDEDHTVSTAASNAIAKILPVDEAREYLKAQAAESSESVHVAVYDAMSKIAKPEDTEFLLAGLPSKNWRTEMNAVQGVERTVRAGSRLKPEDYDKIAAVFGNEITNASNAAVHFFTHVRNEESVRAVHAAADKQGDGTKADVTWRDRTYALRTIYHWGFPANESSLPVVIRQLGDRTANVANEARRLLNHLKRERLISQQDLYPLFLTELESAKAIGTRAGIMREWGSHVDEQYASRVAKVASQTLTEAMEAKSDWSARAYSVTLLGSAGYTADVEKISQCVADDVSNVRSSAGRALEQLAQLCSDEEAALVPPILVPLLTQSTDWRKSAVAAKAAGFYPSETAIQPLIKLLSHSVINVKSAASGSLSRLVQADVALKEKIETPLFAEVGKVAGSWEYGARVLGTLENPAAIPLLTTILTKGAWRSQHNAAKAVQEIADVNIIKDESLNQALISAAQSEVLQVQDAANEALRAISKPTKAKPATPTTPEKKPAA